MTKAKFVEVQPKTRANAQAALTKPEGERTPFDLRAIQNSRVDRTEFRITLSFTLRFSGDRELPEVFKGRWLTEFIMAGLQRTVFDKQKEYEKEGLPEDCELKIRTKRLREI